MLKSMTGYGKYEFINDDYKITVDIRSVNNRYLDLNLKVPRFLLSYEDMIRKKIKENIVRGKVDCYLNVNFFSFGTVDINIDYNLAKKYMQSAENISDYLCLEDKIGLKDILKIPDIISFERKNVNDDELGDLISKVLSQALNCLDDMKKCEGKNLEFDIYSKIDELEKELIEIEKLKYNFNENFREKFYQKYESLLDDKSIIDEKRLEMEIAVLIDRYSIDEEIVRLKSHIYQFKNMILSSGDMGKKLDFMIQEMNRETNTIGSKSNNRDITFKVVNMKTIIEKIREQIQNIE